jgi:menaquinol-cytochrome c reductase iron-sulfur subunit
MDSDPLLKRRSFLKWATHGLGALFAAILGVPAVAYLIDARHRAAPPSDFRTVARLSELKENVPYQVVIRDTRRDAWTIHPSDLVGRVWLIRRPNDKVDAFTAICPHLGCSINFEASAKQFLCPCHGGTFDMTGKRAEVTGRANPAPRGMDALQVQLTPDPDASHQVDDPAQSGKKRPDQLIAVKYQNFMQGKDTPIAKA